MLKSAAAELGPFKNSAENVFSPYDHVGKQQYFAVSNEKAVKVYVWLAHARHSAVGGGTALRAAAGQVGGLN